MAVAAAFAGSLDNGFVNFDDDKYITGNPRVRDLGGENLRWMLTDTSLFYWHPLTYLVHALEVQAFGMEPRGHHATSVLLHALAAVLLLALFLEAARAAGAPAGSKAVLAAGASAALLFGLHPLRVESVAWASEKKDLLCALFMLAGLVAWLRYGTGEPGRRGRWYAAALGALALGMASKPMAVSFPALLLVADGFPLRRFGRVPWTRLVAEKVPFLLVAAAAALPSVLDPRQEALLPTGESVDLGVRATSSLWGAAFGLVRTPWPADLVPFYPLPTAGEVSLASGKYGGSALLLGAGTLLAVLLLRRGRPVFPAAWAFYLLAVLPVSGLRQAGSIETADRFTYVPTIALFLLLGAALVEPFRAGGTRAAAAGAAVAALAAVLGTLTWRQVEVWRDSESLWTRVVEAFPGRVNLAHNNLGAIYHQRALATGDPGLLARAEREYRTALALREDYATAHGNLGLVLLARGDAKGAEACFLRALELQPRLVLAHANLATLYLETGDRERARVHYRAAKALAGALPPRVLDVLAERFPEEPK